MDKVALSLSPPYSSLLPYFVSTNFFLDDEESERAD